MDLSINRYYEAIYKRHSRRKYKDKKIADEVLDNLIEITNKINEANVGARAVVVKECDAEIFKGIKGSYGLITGASSYVAFIGDQQDKNYQEKTGYLGEKIILAATSLGLNTCWLGGLFNLDEVQNDIEKKEQEEILAISTLGYSKEKYTITEKVMSKVVASKKRKDLDELCVGGFNQNWPKWIKTALECGRLAPSAVNRQPWGFIVEGESITVKANQARFSSYVSTRLDCGIAMSHIEIGASYEGEKGYFQYLNDSRVARFVLNK